MQFFNERLLVDLRVKPAYCPNAMMWSSRHRKATKYEAKVSQVLKELVTKGCTAFGTNPFMCSFWNSAHYPPQDDADKIKSIVNVTSKSCDCPILLLYSKAAKASCSNRFQ